MMLFKIPNGTQIYTLDKNSGTVTWSYADEGDPEEHTVQYTLHNVGRFFALGLWVECNKYGVEL